MSSTGWLYTTTYSSGNCQGAVYSQSGYITNSCFYYNGFSYKFTCDADSYEKKTYADSSCSAEIDSEQIAFSCTNDGEVSYFRGCTSTAALPLPTEKTFATTEHFRDTACQDLVTYVADLNQQCVPSGSGSFYANYPAYTTYNNTNCAGKGTTTSQYYSDLCTSTPPMYPGEITTYQSADLIILASYDDDATSNNLNGGAIAGIVIGVTAGLVLIGALVYFFALKKAPMARRQHSDSHSDYNAF